VTVWKVRPSGGGLPFPRPLHVSLAGWVAATALVACACVGCGPDDPPAPDPDQSTACLPEEPPPSGRPTAILGHDNGSGFLPFQPDACLRLNYGPQGGQHVYVSTKLFSPSAATWTLAFDFIADSSGMSSGGTTTSVDSCAAGWTESKNVAVFMNGSESLSGSMKLNATAGALTAEAEALVSIQP
jgi:hypothetical protein